MYSRTPAVKESGRWAMSASSKGTTCMGASSIHGEMHHHPGREMLGDMTVQHPFAGISGIEENIHHRTGGHQHGVFPREIDRKSTRLNSSHTVSSYAVFCLKKKKKHDARKKDRQEMFKLRRPDVAETMASSENHEGMYRGRERSGGYTRLEACKRSSVLPGF